MSKVLHYFYDPLCGWCYAAEPLIGALAEAAQGAFELRLHGGGLFSDTVVPPQKRDYIRQADRRIGELSGQRFGAAYLDGLLADPATRYDSLPPIAAVLAAGAEGPAMLRAIQRAHYIDGRRVGDAAVLAELGQAIGRDRVAFAAELHALLQGEAQRHIEASRQWMDRLGVRGFPTLLLQDGEHWQPLPHEAFYGKPEVFAAAIMETASRASIGGST